MISQNQEHNNSRLDNLNNKNFDSRYLLKTGGKLTGNLTMRNGYAYKFETNKGLTADLGYMDGDDKIHMGSWDYPLELNGKGELMYNGAKVLTSKNISGAGFDADSIGGFTADSFLHTMGDDSKYGKLRIVEHALEFKMKDGDNSAAALRFIRGSKISSSIYGNGNDDILLYPGKQNTKLAPFSFNHDLNFVQYGGAHYIRSSEPGVFFQTWDDDTDTYDNGLSITKPAWGKNELVITNKNANLIVAEFGVHDGEAMKINHSPYIGEHSRRLFLQDEQPTGDVPVGSVWIGF